MIIQKHNLIDIPKDNIFKNDKLERKSIIENLSPIIDNTNEPFILAIDAKWGNGKTTFINLWRAYLNQTYGIQSIYLNAWEIDYSSDPLIVILGELNNYIRNNYSSSDDIKDKFDNVKQIGAKIIKKSLPAFAKGMTNGLLDLDSGIENAISAFSENIAKELIEKFSEEKESINAFKENINILIENIGDSKPFIFFIDELDRCRPLFAIHLLERIKHLLETPGLIFVFSIDKSQLIQTIKSQYGNIDGDSYLKRFFDLEYKLPEPNKDQFCDYLNSFYNWDNLLQTKIIDGFRHKVNHLEMIKYLSKSLDLSLREIEKIFLYTDLIYKSLPERAYEVLLRLIIFLITIKIKDSKLYEELIQKHQKPEYFIEKLINNSITNGYGDTPSIAIFIEALIYLITLTDQELQTFKKELKEKIQVLPDNAKEKYNLEWLMQLLEHKVNYRIDLKNLIQLIIKKIEFIENFS